MILGTAVASFSWWGGPWGRTGNQSTITSSSKERRQQRRESRVAPEAGKDSCLAIRFGRLKFQDSNIFDFSTTG